MLSTAFRCESLSEGKKVSKVRTRAERSWYTGDDRDPSGGVIVEPTPRGRQVCKVNEVERIAPLGAVDDDPHNMLLIELVVDGHPVS